MIGSTLQNRYRLDERIGQGGMGAVYRAHDLLLDRDVAVKILSASGLGTAGRERLLQEARATARLNHPNIVSIYDAGKAGDVSYIVMELVEGTPASAAGLKEIPEILRVVRNICAALEHAHEHGIVHRDLKPENVLITADSTAKLMDFGLARSVSGPRLSQEEGIVGTVLYLAPEQALGQEVDGRADLYSLGVMLYEWTTGSLPFDGDDPLAVVAQHIHAPVLPPRQRRPDLPEWLEPVILRLLAKDPAERYASARQLLNTLAAADGSPAETAGRMPANNLPVMVSRFIGREQELAEVKSLLSASRLVTLTGAGGSGKTRLALQVAGELLWNFRDGVWFVELAALSEPLLVTQAVASIFEVREQPGRALIDSLADFLHDRQVLLILDNCEHLVEPCAFLAERLLRASTRLTILSTSREALGIAGEVAWAVPTLSAPDPAQCRAAQADPRKDPTKWLSELLAYESVRLFVDRAMTVNPAFQLTQQNALAVAQICYRLDGIPLAIELAAARMRALSVDQILARLDDRFSLLTLGSRTALPRHQTLRATIDWSYDLLPEMERQLLSRLAVFVDGWTLEAAEAVCAGDKRPAPARPADYIHREEILDLLTRLVNKSLVVKEEQDGVVRYRLLETIRQYAREKLADSGEMEALQARHLNYFLEIAEQAAPRLRGGDQLTWLRRLEAEYDNFRAALDWALLCQETTSALRLTGDLALFWYFRGYWSEGREWLERVLSLPQVETGPASAEQKAARAKALAGAGWLADESGREEAYYRESLARYRDIKDDWGTAFSLRGLGILAMNRSDIARSRDLLDQSLGLFRSANEPWGIALVLFNIGWMFAEQDEKVKAQRQWEESLDLFRQTGDRWGQAVVLDALSYLARLENDYKRAVKLSKQSLALFKELGDQAGVATSLSRLGGVAYRREEFEQAMALFEESLALHREQGSTWDVAEIQRVLSMIACYRGDYRGAALLLEDSLARFQELGSRYGLAWTHASLGLHLYLQNDLDRAANRLDEALAYFRTETEKNGQAFATYLLGLVRLCQRDFEQAGGLLQQSQALYRELGEKNNIAAVLGGLGRLALSRGNLEEATGLLQESFSIRREIGLKRGMAESLEDLGRLEVAGGEFDKAVRLFAAAGKLRESAGTPVPPVDRAEVEQSLHTARENLGEARFQAAWTEGQAVPAEQIAGYAE
jgi:non-specific serine/threonine protein kinase